MKKSSRQCYVIKILLLRTLKKPPPFHAKRMGDFFRFGISRIYKAYFFFQEQHQPCASGNRNDGHARHNCGDRRPGLCGCLGRGGRLGWGGRIADIGVVQSVVLLNGDVPMVIMTCLETLQGIKRRSILEMVMEMNNQERIAYLKAKDCQKYFGVKKKTFDVMLQILEKDYQRKHKMDGRPPKLMIMLQYYREYRVMDNIAFDYGVSKSTISDAIKWVEETLVKDGVFCLPSKRKLLEDSSLEVVLVDATECEIERPQKTAQILLQQEKEAHTETTGSCRCKDIRHNLYSCFSWKTHDFNLFKESKLHIRSAIILLADKGYLGIFRLHKNSTLSIKASKKHKLAAEEGFNDFQREQFAREQLLAKRDPARSASAVITNGQDRMPAQFTLSGHFACFTGGTGFGPYILKVDDTEAFYVRTHTMTLPTMTRVFSFIFTKNQNITSYVIHFTGHGREQGRFQFGDPAVCETVRNILRQRFPEIIVR